MNHAGGLSEESNLEEHGVRGQEPGKSQAGGSWGNIWDENEMDLY